MLLRRAGWLGDKPIGFLALIGMGAVLAAVVHAPLASILILMEVTDNRDVVLPAMLACVVATGVARTISRDSIYTLGLRRRGVLVGTGQDAAVLRRLQLDQLKLEPVRAYPIHGPLERLLPTRRPTTAGTTWCWSTPTAVRGAGRRGGRPHGAAAERRRGPAPAGRGPGPDGTCRP